MRNLRILCYHDIASSSDIKLPGRAFPTLAEFRAQMAFLKENYRLVTLDEAGHYCKAGKGPSQFSVSITFDDGAAGVMLAAPVLFELGIPFTVFLSTKFIGSDELPWFAYLNAIMDSGSKRGISLEKCQLAHPLEFATFRKFAKKKLLAEPYRRQMEILSAWAEDAEMTLVQIASGPRAFLTWEQARELAAKGAAFGSHTHSHVDLRVLGDAELETEFAAAAQAITEHLGKEHSHFVAYPDGRFNRRILEAARQYHKLGLAASYGNASWNDLYRLPRRGVSGGDMAKLRRQLSTGKELASWVKGGIRGILGDGL